MTPRRSIQPDTLQSAPQDPVARIVSDVWMHIAHNICSTDPCSMAKELDMVEKQTREACGFTTPVRACPGAMLLSCASFATALHHRCIARRGDPDALRGSLAVSSQQWKLR